MGILNLASGDSCWRGYRYYEEKRVLELRRPDGTHLQARVAGSGAEPYNVTLDLEHIRRSSCDCPLAAGRRVICKHMVSAYFTAFPEEAKKYYADVLRAEREWEVEQAALADKLERYVRTLKRKDAQDKLLEVLEMAPDWLWDRFVRDYVE